MMEVVIADCIEPTKAWVEGAGTAKFTLGSEGWTKSVQPREPGLDLNEVAAKYAPISSRHTWYVAQLEAVPEVTTLSLKARATCISFGKAKEALSDC